MSTITSLPLEILENVFTQLYHLHRIVGHGKHSYACTCSSHGFKFYDSGCGKKHFLLPDHYWPNLPIHKYTPAIFNITQVCPYWRKIMLTIKIPDGQSVIRYTEIEAWGVFFRVCNGQEVVRARLTDELRILDAHVHVDPKRYEVLDWMGWRDNGGNRIAKFWRPRTEHCLKKPTPLKTKMMDLKAWADGDFDEVNEEVAERYRSHPRYLPGGDRYEEFPKEFVLPQRIQHVE